MSLAYQRDAAPASGWDAWGSVVYGNTRIAVRRLIVLGGIAILLIALQLRTGEAGLGQLWASALLALPLLALGSLTRTVGIRLLGRLVLVGATLMGAMYLLAVVLITPLLGEISRPRDFVVPALEQLLVMLPFVVLVWRWREGRTWSLGATDLLLTGVSVGIGFGLMEHAILRADSDWLEWLPLVGYHPLRLTPGHAIWAGLGGATLGLGLLLRSRGPIWLAVAASGSLLAFLDHAANNNTNWGDDLSGLLNTITLSGWLAVLAFLALVATCIGADAYVQRQMPSAPHHMPPPRQPGFAGLRAAWEFLTLRRQLAIADFHWRHAPEPTREAPGREADRLDSSLALMALERRGALPHAGPASADPHEPNPHLPPSVGGIGGTLILLTGLGGLLASVLSSVGLATDFGLLASLDVGANCDASCLASGAGGMGGSAGPGNPRADPKAQEQMNELSKLQEQYRQERRQQGGGPAPSPGGPRNDATETIKDHIANWRERVPDRPSR